MAVTAAMVKELRQATDAPMMDCKKALTECDGDMGKAKEFLRERGIAKSAKKADRIAAEGSAGLKVSADFSKATVVEINSETDFVAKNGEFQAVGQKIVDLAFDQSPATTEELLALKYDDLTIAEKLSELVGKIGEKLEIAYYERMTGEVVVPYIHAGSKLGVLVSLSNANGSDVKAAGRDVAMQIAAMKPIAVGRDSVDQATIDHELAIGREQALAEGKPEHIIDKIAQGKLNKFFSENTLLAQKFVKDNSMTIEQYLNSVQNGLTVTDFKRISIGG